MPLINFTLDETAWAARVALRLRFVQADFAERPAEERRSFLEDELRRALKEVPVEDRGRRAQALAEHFPTGFTVEGERAEAIPAENSPEALVQALVEIAPQLPKRLLADFGLRLQEAGYMEIKSTTLMDTPPEELLRAFPLDPLQPVDLQRLFRTLAVFAEYYIGLETIIWQIWQELSPNALIRRDTTPGGDVRKLSARYLQGDREVSAEQVRLVVEKTRKLMAGLLGAIPAGGTAFLERFAADFSPENIAALARADKSLGGWTEDAKNWNMYKKLVDDHQGQVFQEKMFEAIARKAAALMTGTNRRET